MEKIHDTPPAPNTPRPPNKNERKQLAEWLCHQGHELDDALLIASHAYIGVYDRYVTDCPGYVGKVMSVVWSGSPTFFDVFTWEKGTIVQNERDAR